MIQEEIYAFLNRAHVGYRPVHAWFLESVLFTDVGVCMCVVVSTPRALITSHMKSTCNTCFTAFLFL